METTKGNPMKINILELAPDLGIDAHVFYDEFIDSYTLYWSDGVANEWSENFDMLSDALARLAALVHCGENEWELGLNKVDDHVRESRKFLAQVCG
jgi:hypothetical protein